MYSNHTDSSPINSFVTNVNNNHNDANTLNVQISSKNIYNFPELKNQFEIIDKIGEGTFSNVFKAKQLYPIERIVALKRIHPTSSPNRIFNEIHCLSLLEGKNNIIELLGGMRYHDQVTLVLEYFDHSPFKIYLYTMNLIQIKNYMRALFIALNYLHSFNIIHRDIKPNNFLYSIESGRFCLVDFGLAQKADEINTERFQQQYMPPIRRKLTFTENVIPTRPNYVPSISSMPNFLSTNVDLRPSPVAPRAGTRGFRAPEVLLRCNDQTVAIDVWAAGVILLTIFSQRYPFFSAPDDMSALAEIAVLCGTDELQQAATSCGKRLHCPEYTMKPSLRTICENLRITRDFDIPEDGLDLVSRCLDPNPKTRITAKDALFHPFLSE